MKKVLDHFIVKPVKKTIVHFSLVMEAQIRDEYDLRPSWWEKNKALVFNILIYVITAGLCVATMYFTYKYNMGGFNNTPGWVKDFFSTFQAIQGSAISGSEII